MLSAHKPRQNTELCSLVYHPSTLHIANHKQHHVFLHATHQSIVLLPQLSFLLHNVVFFIIVLVTIERVVVMKCITRLHQSPTRCVCATLVPSSGHHFALVLWLWYMSFTTPLCDTHTHHIWRVDAVEWHTRGFTQLGTSEG